MTHQDYINLTKNWIQKVVIGLDLCPFAAAPIKEDKVRFLVNEEDDNIALVNDLSDLSLTLLEPSNNNETAFLIIPSTDLGFEDFFHFTQVAQDIMDKTHPSTFVLVAFHPEFRYDGSTQEDTANATNRSPYPMIHVLKEKSLTEAAHTIDVEQLVNRNQRILSEMSWDSIKELLH